MTGYQILGIVCGTFLLIVVIVVVVAFFLDVRDQARKNEQPYSIVLRRNLTDFGMNAAIFLGKMALVLSVVWIAIYVLNLPGPQRALASAEQYLKDFALRRAEDRKTIVRQRCTLDDGSTIYIDELTDEKWVEVGDGVTIPTDRIKGCVEVKVPRD
jgi:hypothetical protein